MESNSSPWSYAYNRIVPSASNSTAAEEFQHQHIASFTAGQSAQSLLLQAATFNASGASFVSPSPISSYNPVFQQIYHHAAASVQPKPAHYSSTSVNTPHRQLQIPSPINKQIASFQSQPSIAVVSSGAVPTTSSSATNYYGDNSSSSGTSSSPTTSALTSTTLTWNTPMISNPFLAIQQQQVPQHLNVVTEKNALDVTLQQIAQKTSKTPRKRQPKKTLSTEYMSNESPLQQSQNPHQRHAQQDPVTAYYDFNSKWNSPLKIQNDTPSSVQQTSNSMSTISIPTYVNPHISQQQQIIVATTNCHIQQPQSQQAQSQQHHTQNQHQQTQLPQPAHQAQAESHLTNLTTYYPGFSQQITSQYNPCMQQNVQTLPSSAVPSETLYNFNNQQTLEHQQGHMPTLQNQDQNTSLQITQLQYQPTISPETPSTDIMLNSEQATSTPIIEPTFGRMVTESVAKVIVPNIEEELNFLVDPANLTQGYVRNEQTSRNLDESRNNTNFGIRNPLNSVGNPATKTNICSTDSNVSDIGVVTQSKKAVCVGTSIGEKKTQFMDSYLKFLQGERSDSPPPIVRTVKKLAYQKTSGSSIKRNKQTGNDLYNNQIAEYSSVSQTDKEKSGTSETTRIARDISPTDTNSRTSVIAGDDGHKIKILSQTKILPKKRPHAQLTTTGSVIHHHESNISNQQSNESSFQSYVQQEEIHRRASAEQQFCRQLDGEEAANIKNGPDPLALPPRREQCLRKAKQNNLTNLISNREEISAEPEEFTDSDTDPVWTPNEEGFDSTKSLKKKAERKSKGFIRKNNGPLQQNHLATLYAELDLPTSSAYNTSSSNVEHFKTGDFIVLRCDLVNDWPIIWQVDSKCILQKFEPFCQNGKMFYRNMSKYASWNLETKKLYLKAPVRIKSQSHAETVVEFMRVELLADDTEQFIKKIMDDYLRYRDHFEIYIQTMISQVLDPSFFSEITREKDEYFLGSVRTIDSIMENCKRKLLSITPWTHNIAISIETWPKCHVFTEWGQSSQVQKNCSGCQQPRVSARFLLFGQPYNPNTMQVMPTDVRMYEKDILLCDSCARKADIFHKIAHEKYNLFITCSKRVTELQQENPNKTSTEILNDLLAGHNWVDELFRLMRSTWAEVESLERQKRVRDCTQ